MQPTEIGLLDADGWNWLEIGQYPDGMPFIDFWADKTPNVMLLRPKSLTTFMAAMFLADAWRARGLADMPTLVLPFVPGARQDRRMTQGDYLFTARSIADEINIRGFRRVVVLDPHSAVITGMIRRCDVQRVRFHSSFGNCVYAGVIAPDGGAVKRAEDAAKELKLPVFHAWKKRDTATGALTGFGCQPLDEAHYLVVDDICDGGGTFVGLAEIIRSYGATADLFVTHGLFTKGTTVLRNCYRRIITTDSIFDEQPFVTVIRESLYLSAMSY